MCATTGILNKNVRHNWNPKQKSLGSPKILDQIMDQENPHPNPATRQPRKSNANNCRRPRKSTPKPADRPEPADRSGFRMWRNPHPIPRTNPPRPEKSTSKRASVAVAVAVVAVVVATRESRLCRQSPRIRLSVPPVPSLFLRRKAGHRVGADEVFFSLLPQ